MRGKRSSIAELPWFLATSGIIAVEGDSGFLIREVATTELSLTGEVVTSAFNVKEVL